MIRKARESSLWLGLLFQTFLFALTLRAQETVSPGVASVRGKLSIAGPDEFVEDMLRARAFNTYEGSMNRLRPVPPYGLSEKAVVFLEADGDQIRYPPAAYHPKLIQTELMFRPLVLPVVVGTTVDFPNNDNLFHNVFSYSQSREFDLGHYPQGQSKAVRFDRPGIVKVYCDIHSHMYATILVLRNPYFAVPNDEGSYRINGVPPGTYRVNFWFGRELVETRTLTLKAEETRTENFSH